jgi:malto-oligosyltrehalose trehalohydrolase
MRRHHELPFGAERGPEGVRFRLWAPAARHVALALEDHSAPLAMLAEGAGWYGLTAAAGTGSRYRFIVDGRAVPDPAARHQPDGVHGPSEVIDPRTYDWRDAGWRGRPWHEAILYELHIGAFSPAGTFAGAIERLDDLARLGVTAIEIMPVAAFAGTRNWGYDGVLPFAPAAPYGRPDDMKRFVEAAHRRGLSVLLDVVYNHFGPEGNYLGLYAPQFFTDRHKTPWGDAINFDGPESSPVRRFFVENALYWLEEFHLDGLRFDAVHAIIDESARHILAEIADEVAARFTDERPIHLVLENDRNEARWLTRYTAQWNDDLHHALHVLATGDRDGYYADYPDAPEQLGRTLAEGFAYQGEASRYRKGALRGERSAHLPPTSFVAFLQNHDQVGNTPFGTRLSRRADAARLPLIIAILVLSPQVPLLFMGEEYAAPQPFPFFCDFAPDLGKKVRDGRKAEFAGFRGFSGELPDPCAESTFRAAKLEWADRAREPHRAWLEFYRSLLALRAAEIVPRLESVTGGRAKHRTIGPDAIEVTWTLGDGARLVLRANFGKHHVDLGAAPASRILYASGGEDGVPNSLAVRLIPP